MTTRSRSTRRSQSLLVILLLGAAAAIAPAGGKPARAATGKSESHAARCSKRNAAAGVVKFSDWQFPDTLSPGQTSLAVSQEVIDGMFDTLFAFDSHARLIAEDAAKLPTTQNGGIKDGGKTYVITLKQGLHWSNGAEITSQAVKFGWQVDSDQASGPYCSGSCDVISRIDTPSTYVAVIHLKQVSAAFLTNGVPQLWPVVWPGAWNNDPHVAAEKIWQTSAFNFEGPNYPTNGPYQVTAGGFVPNDRITLQPMKYYTGMTCGGYVKQMIFAFYSDKSAMIAAAASRQTDVTQDYTPADLSDLRKHKTYTLHVDPGLNVEHLEFNVDPTYNDAPNPLANANVRLALALALDKNAMIRSALGVNAVDAKAVTAWTFLVNTPQLVQPFADTKLVGQWDPITKKYTTATGSGTALADARTLLARTQWKNGFTLDFLTTSGNPVRQAQENFIAQQWGRLGVKVSPQYIAASKLFADWTHGGQADHGQFQVLQFAYLGSPDPDSFKYNLASTYIDRRATVKSPINGNNSGVADSVIDRAFATGSQSLNTTVRRKSYNTIQVEVNKMAYWIPLYFRPMIATDDGRVATFSNNPTYLGPEWNMFAWRLKG